jgi:gas vesicle protein
MTDGSGQDQGTLDAAREQAQEQAHKAAEQARNVAGQASDRARGMVDERSTQVGHQIGQQADDIRSAAQQLREQGKDGPAKLAEQAADRAERVGGYLRDNDADTILSDVERMARQNPWAVVAGGIALGFAASRFLKASSRQRYQSSQSTEPRQLPRVTTPSPDPSAAALVGGTTPPPRATPAPAGGARVGSF